MNNDIVQLTDKNGNNVFPIAGAATQDSISKSMLEEGVFEGPELFPAPAEAYVRTNDIVDGAVTSDKIDYTTMNYYPSSEQVVGEWNGKPLYRKVFTGTPSLTANTVWTSELSPTSGTVDEIVSARGSWKYYDIDNLTNWAIIGNALNEGNVYSAIIKTGTYPMAIRLRTAYTMTSSYKVTVEYTKV